MGREVKRVPVDFDPPLGELWEGYRCPFEVRACPMCLGGSESALGEFLMRLCASFCNRAEETIYNRKYDNVFGYSLFHNEAPPKVVQEFLDAFLANPDWPKGPAEDFIKDVLSELSHGMKGLLGRVIYRFFPDRPVHKNPPKELVEWINKQDIFGEPGFLGYSSGTWFRMRDHLWSFTGLPKEMLQCTFCEDGTHPDDSELVKLAREWESTDPPEGEGWQLWETVSEGSPVSPVFETAEGLVKWLMGEGYSQKSARALVDSGWAPSMLIQQTAHGTTIIENGKG